MDKLFSLHMPVFYEVGMFNPLFRTRDLNSRGQTSRIAVVDEKEMTFVQFRVRVYLSVVIYLFMIG